MDYTPIILAGPAPHSMAEYLAMRARDLNVLIVDSEKEIPPLVLKNYVPDRLEITYSGKKQTRGSNFTPKKKKRKK